VDTSALKVLRLDVKEKDISIRTVNIINERQVARTVEVQRFVSTVNKSLVAKNVGDHPSVHMVKSSVAARIVEASRFASTVN